jgi:hypothetical protein
MKSMKRGGVLVGVGVVVIVVTLVVSQLTQRPQMPKPPQKASVLTDGELDVIPTVSESVKVRLENVQKGKEIRLVIDGVPPSTNAIEYEITYPTDEKEAEGLFGSVTPEDGENEFGKRFERQITVGTCSRNVCRYHTVTGPYQVTVKFEGAYGARLYQGQFPSALRD